MPKTKILNGYPYVEYNKETYPEEEVISRSKKLYHWMNQRRTVRQFSDRSIPIEVIENIVATASAAPSGAHKQPWTFCVVSNPDLKKQIRKAAEEEHESYHNRMSESWLKDLQPLGLIGTSHSWRLLHTE
jgi:iodotyrosine deiodinase